MEVTKEVKTIKVYFLCPKCLNGDLRSFSCGILDNPPRYLHKCSNKECDYTETFTRTIYPYTKTMEV